MLINCISFRLCLSVPFKTDKSSCFGAERANNRNIEVRGCGVMERSGRGNTFWRGCNVVAGAIFFRSAHSPAPGSAYLLHVHGSVADNTSLRAAGSAV